MASSRPDDGPPSTRGYGLGVELAASIVGFALVGIWIDHSFDTDPWGTLICVIFGFVGGFYNFLRSSFKILHTSSVRPARNSARTSPRKPEKTDERGADPQDGT
jgi:F0F1-type ATP synthase assembly protein I